MSLAMEVRRSFASDGGDSFDLDASLAVDRGETLVVLGPSGAGKTLLLETIAGLHEYDGTVTLDGASLDGRPPEQRAFGFVFQGYALFPHMTVRENVAFGQRYRDGGADPGALLRSLGVGDLADRRPPTLSGGERQRVALARALAVDPEVLLLDEPLSSLDVPTHRSLRDDLHDILADATAVYVTHDRTTARVLGDRIAVMRAGRIVQVGTPDAVFEGPASPFVARFTGANCVPLTGPDDPLVAGVADMPPDASHVAVRPERIRLGEGPISATVDRYAREEGLFRVRLSVDGRHLEAFSATPPDGEGPIAITVPAAHVSFPTGPDRSHDATGTGS